MTRTLLVITCTVGDWQQWTGLPMPGTRQYVIPAHWRPSTSITNAIWSPIPNPASGSGTKSADPHAGSGPTQPGPSANARRAAALRDYRTGRTAQTAGRLSALVPRNADYGPWLCLPGRPRVSRKTAPALYRAAQNPR